MIQTKTTSRVNVWNARLRVKVGDAVMFAGTTYINKTGINSIPTTAADWSPVNKNREIIISGRIFVLAKNPANNLPENEKTIELNDYVFYGFRTNTLFIKSARYVSGDISDFGTAENDYQDGSYRQVDFDELPSS